MIISLSIACFPAPALCLSLQTVGLAVENKGLNLKFWIRDQDCAIRTATTILENMIRRHVHVSDWMWVGHEGVTLLSRYSCVGLGAFCHCTQLLSEQRRSSAKVH